MDEAYLKFFRKLVLCLTNKIGAVGGRAGCVLCGCVADTYIGAEGAKAVAKALEKNTTVTKIDLAGE